MKVVRFVCDTEMEMYISGARLFNCDLHTDNKTSSIGFCFAELTEKRDAEKWMRKLCLLTSCEWCIEFDTDKFSIPLKESIARYSDDDDFSKTIDVREWCTTDYSIKTHPYTRFGKCPSILGICIGKKIKWILNKSTRMKGE